MKKILFAVLLLGTSLMADLKQVWVTPDFIHKNKHLKIIDIRTPSEWKETGIVKNSYPIMFFNERGNFNVEQFLNQLNKVVKKGEPFALICRVGSRTGMVSKFLSEKLNYNVIDLKGGIMKLIQEGYHTSPYRQKN